jgi:hypothetical protein
MQRGNVTKSFAAAAVSFFAAYAVTAREVKNLPADATAHFIYFPPAAISWMLKTKIKYATWLD